MKAAPTTQPKLLANRLRAFEDRLLSFQRNTPKNKRRALGLLNERHFAIRMGAKFVVCDEMVDEQSVLPQSDTEFKKRYQPHTYQRSPEKKKKQSLGELWWNWPERRAYQGTLVFRPNERPRGLANRVDFNTWRGFRVRPAGGEWNLFRDHLETVVCRGNTAWCEYLLNYFAHMVQFPGRLPGVALVIRGQQGTGKTLVYKMFELLLYSWNAVLLEDPKRIAGHFNSHLAEKILVCADEALFARDKQIVGKLKSTITAEHMLFEAKGFDAVPLQNYVRLLIISNDEHVVHAAADERRYFVLETADTFAQRRGEALYAAAKRRRPYFDAISRQMMREGGAAAMMYDLQRRDIAGFDPRIFPDTPFLARQKELSREPHEQWLADKLADGGWWFTNPEKHPSRRLVYSDYCADAPKYNRRTPLLTTAQVGRFLSEVFGAGVAHRQGREHGKQIGVYCFPSLTQARAMWERYSGNSGGKLRVRLSKTRVQS
jgi:hypothetical protein